MKKLGFCLLITVSCVSWVNGKDSIEDLGKYFSGYNGCFILYDESKDEYTIYNEGKSKIRMSPCSTYKIIHSLIGLETGVLEDENTAFQWDGTKYPIQDWNKDQTLASAVKYSAVWYFQKVAIKIGKETEQDFLRRIKYGNADLSGDIKSFWLQSSLKISPVEQLEILKEFYHYQLPFSKRNVDMVKKIIVLSNEKDEILSGKTGTGSHNNKPVNGWFVGYLEKGKNVYYFVSNIEGEDGAAGYKAKEITLSILRDKKLL